MIDYAVVFEAEDGTPSYQIDLGRYQQERVALKRAVRIANVHQRNTYVVKVSSVTGKDVVQRVKYYPGERPYTRRSQPVFVVSATPTPLIGDRFDREYLGLVTIEDEATMDFIADYSRRGYTVTITPSLTNLSIVGLQPMLFNVVARKPIAKES